MNCRSRAGTPWLKAFFFICLLFSFLLWFYFLKRSICLFLLWIFCLLVVFVSTPLEIGSFFVSKKIIFHYYFCCYLHLWIGEIFSRVYLLTALPTPFFYLFHSLSFFFLCVCETTCEMTCILLTLSFFFSFFFLVLCSPYPLNVAPGPTFAPNCAVSGDQLRKGIVGISNRYRGKWLCLCIVCIMLVGICVIVIVSVRHGVWKCVLPLIITLKHAYVNACVHGVFYALWVVCV